MEPTKTFGSNTIMRKPERPPLLTSDKKDGLLQAIHEAGIMPTRNGEIVISISPQMTIGNIKIVSNTG